MKMKRKITILVITLLLGHVTANAEWKDAPNTNAIPLLVGTNDYAGLLTIPANALTPEQSNVVATIKTSKIPSGKVAEKILADREESLRWRSVDYSRVEDPKLRKLTRGVEGFGSKGDYVWVFVVWLHYSEVFLVNTVNGELLHLMR